MLKLIVCLITVVSGELLATNMAYACPPGTLQGWGIGVCYPKPVGVSSAATSRPQLSGTYQVVQSDCDDTGILFIGQKAVLQATDSNLRIGANYVTGFIAAFDFAVGIQKQSCLGDCYFLLNGIYSSTGTQFKDTSSFVAFADAANPSQPVYNGEVDFNLTGDTLQIDVISADAINPSASHRTCLLTKLQSL
jgi:hypothetical protein